jgi:hypothetical protein
MANLPAVKLIKDVLDGLLGRDVELAPCAAALTSVDAIGGVLASYIDDGGALQAAAGWDLPAAAYVGAAVGLVPRGGADAAVEERYLPESLVENLAEVSNVLASVFQAAGNPHLRLDKTYRPAASAPDPETALLYAPGQRIDLSVDVPGYGAGRLAVSMRF